MPSTIAEAADESASAVLKDTNGQNVGTASFTQTPAGVLLKKPTDAEADGPPGRRPQRSKAMAGGTAIFVGSHT